MNITERAVETETREARFVKWWKDKYPAHTVAKATHFTTHSFCKESERTVYHYRKRIQKSSVFVKPNVMEYEIEAEFIHEFMHHSGFFRQLLVQETMYCTML
jgi:Xaa-Pro aminopeptidase